MWVRFGGVTRLVDIWHGSGGTLEEAAKEMWGIPTETETYVVADGSLLNWTEAERLGGGQTVDVIVPMKGGSRKKNAKKRKKQRHLGILVARRKSGRRRGGEKTVEEWERGVKAALKRWAKNSMRQKGKSNEFLDVAAQAKRERREEMVSRYAEGIWDVPGLDAEKARQGKARQGKGEGEG